MIIATRDTPCARRSDDHARRVRLRAIADAEHADRHAVARDHDRRHAVVRRCAARAAAMAGVMRAAFGKQARRAAHDLRASCTRPSTPRPGSARTSRGSSRRDAAALRRREDGGGDRMFGLRFDRRRQLDDSRRRMAVDRHAPHRASSRPVVTVPVLSKATHAHAGEPLEVNAALDRARPAAPRRPAPTRSTPASRSRARTGTTTTSSTSAR